MPRLRNECNARDAQVLATVRMTSIHERCSTEKQAVCVPFPEGVHLRSPAETLPLRLVCNPGCRVACPGLMEVDGDPLFRTEVFKQKAKPTQI